MKSKLILCLFFLTFFFSAFSSFSQDTIWRKPKFFLQLDRYNSFVAQKGADIIGLKAGLEFGKKYRFGIGFYDLTSDIIEEKALTSSQAAEAPNDTVKAKLKMSYIPLCFEYIFYDVGKWQFGIPVHLGFGGTYFEYFDAKGRTRQIKDQSVMLTDVAVSGQYKILKWIGVGAGFGVRKMLVDNPAIKRDFNSPLYNLRIKLFLGEIYRTAFPNGLCGKKKNSETKGSE